MSCSDRNCATGTRPRSVITWLRCGSSGSWSNWRIRTEWMGEPTAATPAGGQHRHVVDAVGVEGGHRSAGGRPEADDDCAQPATVVTGAAGELQCLQHRAVAGELVVLVEHVEPDVAVAGPVVHGLEGDQGQPPVDGELGELGILDAVGPAPQDAALASSRRSACCGFGSTTTSDWHEDLLTRGRTPATRSDRARSETPKRSPYPCSSVIRARRSASSPRQVLRVEREPVLVLLGGRADDPEVEQRHVLPGA